MKRRATLVAACTGLGVLSAIISARAADEPVFSGPQPGEKLPAFEVQGVYDERAGERLDFVTQADGRPLVLVFVHQLTRPSAGVVWCVMAHAESLADQGVHRGIVWLTADVSETEHFLNFARDLLALDAPAGIFPGGEEGPGSLGLNRNVALTILMARGGKVMANHALVQPGFEDVPKIAADIAALVGAAPPTTAQIDAVFHALPHPSVFNNSGRGHGEMMAPESRDERLRELLRQMAQDATSEEQVARAAQAIDRYIGEDPRRRQVLARLAGYLVELNMGNDAARRQFIQWAESGS